MPKREYTVGSGITKQTVTAYSGPDMGERLAAELDGALRRRGNWFEVKVEPVEEWCDVILESAGRRPGDLEGDDDTIENIASQIKKRLLITRSQIDSGGPVGAARFALELGQMIGRYGMKLRWEAFALRGQKFSENKRGESELTQVLRAMLDSEGASISAGYAWQCLMEMAESGHKAIQEVDDDRVYWRDSKGIERGATRKTIENRLSTLRKDFS